MKIKCPACEVFVRVREDQRPHTPAEGGLLSVRVITPHFFSMTADLGRCDFSNGIVTPDQYDQFEWQP